MIKRWIPYLIILAGAIAFYGIYEGYISYYLLLVVILFPFFSLAVSLYGMTNVRVKMKPLLMEIRRGEAVNAILDVDPHCRLPLSLLKIIYTTKSITFSQEVKKTTFCIYGCTYSEIYLPLDTNHVGCINFELKKIRVYDYLGLFFVSLKLPEKRHIIVLPNLVKPVPMPVFPIDKMNNKGLKPKPGGGFSEDYDLREYRIGDPLNAIHWKLTTKLDKLIVKEPLISEKGKIYLCFNLFGTADEIDHIFGQISYLFNYLMSRMIQFYLCWYDKCGNLMVEEMNEPSDYTRFITNAFMQPIESSGIEIDNKAYKDADWHYLISPNLQVKGDEVNE